MSPALSVVVPVYNGAHVLPTTVPAMMAQELPAEWVFVDDGSTDESATVLADLLARHYPLAGGTAKVVSLPENVGRGAAREAGVAATEGPVLCFLDCDVAPDPGYLAALAGTLRQRGAVAAVGRVRLGQPDSRDPYHLYLDAPGRGPGFHHAASPTPWHYFLLGVAAVTREAFRDAGGLVDTVPYGEDMELGARLGRSHPNGLRFAPGATALIYDAGDLAQAIHRMEAFGRESVPVLIARHPELAGPLRYAWVRGGGQPLRSAVMRWAASQGVSGLIERTLPVLPRSFWRAGVRYLLAAALARGVSQAAS